MSYLRLFHPKRHPCAILLVVQLLGMLLYPFIENTEAGHIGFNVFGIVVLGITTGMVRRTPGLAWVSACIAGPVIVLLVLQMVWRAVPRRVVVVQTGTSAPLLLLLTTLQARAHEPKILNSQQILDGSCQRNASAPRPLGTKANCCNVTMMMTWNLWSECKPKKRFAVFCGFEANSFCWSW